jgi:hypothetical protein
MMSIPAFKNAFQGNQDRLRDVLGIEGEESPQVTTIMDDLEQLQDL